MKRTVLLAAVLMTAGSLLAADAKDEVASAARKLGAAANYSWNGSTTNVNAGGGGGGNGGRGGRGGGPISGKTETGGYTMVTFGAGDNAMQGVVKSGKGAVQTQDGWQTIAELTADNGGGGGGGFNRGMMSARRLQNLKAPAAEVEAMLPKLKNLAKADDGYAGEFTEEGAKSMLTFGPPRGGGDGPEISDAKATVKFWVKDGMLNQYETHVMGTISFNGNEMKRDTTTKVEIKDVGTTKVEVPEDAKKKL